MSQPHIPLSQIPSTPVNDASNQQQRRPLRPPSQSGSYHTQSSHCVRMMMSHPSPVGFNDTQDSSSHPSLSTSFHPLTSDQWQRQNQQKIAQQRSSNLVYPEYESPICQSSQHSNPYLQPLRIVQQQDSNNSNQGSSSQQQGNHVMSD